MAKQAEKLNTPIKTAQAHVRGLRISPQKMRLITNLIKKQWALDALVQLQFINKKGTKFAADLIKSAMANAENNFHLKRDHLFISEITCDAGPKLKRFLPKAQGRASDMRRPTAHIHVTLTEMLNAPTRLTSAAKLVKKQETTKKSDQSPRVAEITDGQETTKNAEKAVITQSQVEKNESTNEDEQGYAETSNVQ